MNNKLVLIDGHSILNRAFYGVPNLSNSEGLHTNAIYGFLNILFKILEEEQADYLTVAFDVKQPTFRHEMYKAYKGTRKPMPEELREQVPVIKDVLKAMNINVVEKPGFEADDILGTLAKRAEKEGFLVSLVSGDRDLLQIATEKIKIRIPKTKGSKTEIEDYNTDDVKEKYQLLPEQIIDLKGLMGDTADNIPGVPGIGEKTASKILLSFETIENAFQHIDEVMPNKARESLKEHYDLAILSKKLATIDIHAPIEFNMNQCKIENMYNEEAFLWFKKLEFKNMISKFNCDIKHDDSIEDEFIIIYDFSEVELTFKEIENTPVIGVYLLQEKNEVYGLSLSYNEKKGVFIPVQGFITKEYIIDAFLCILNNNSIKYVTNLKESLSLVNYNNFKRNDTIKDLAVASYLINPMKDTYHYDDIARDFCDMTVPSKEELLGKLTFEKAVVEKEREVSFVACYHAYICKTASIHVLDKLNELGMMKLYEEVEMPLVYTLFDMEQRGILVDKNMLKVYADKLLEKIVLLEKEIYKLAGEEFNINSPKQLGVILFEKLKLPFGKKTKTGYSTSADILEKLRSEDPIVSMVLEYRQLTKLKSTYADGLANYINPLDNRIHGKFNQTITATGRISSTEPNLQNIPIRMELGREIRKVFIPKEGFVFLDADYSQIELRVLAHMSNDERLIKAYNQEQDIHRITASEVFHTPLDEVTSEQRSNAKAVNFGIVYGISSFGLGQDLNITRKEAETYIKKYFDTYPKVKEYLDNLVSVAKEKGFVSTMYGRIRPIPEISSSNFMQRSFGERIAMNSPIQGTAADIIKIAMVRVNERLENEKLESKLLLQIHDELLVETKKDEVEVVRNILEEEMSHAISLDVPLEIDVKQGDSWFEAK